MSERQLPEGVKQMVCDALAEHRWDDAIQIIRDELWRSEVTLIGNAFQGSSGEISASLRTMNAGVRRANIDVSAEVPIIPDSPDPPRPFGGVRFLMTGCQVTCKEGEPPVFAIHGEHDVAYIALQDAIIMARGALEDACTRAIQAKRAYEGRR